TDVIMPGMNGRELVEKIRQLRPQVRVLFMSGYTSDAVAHRGILDGEVEFISKPFSLKEFVQKVREVLNRPTDF
ncbi:MAG TPA: response regulator, partial [Acidobacteriota bacterium]|nr:response regulator [Acidobacteriota bacterium]